MLRNRTSRRDILRATASTAIAVLSSTPYVARAAAVPEIRYASGGGIGPNSIDTIFFTDYMKKNVMRRYGKDYTLSVTYTRGTPEAASLLIAEQADIAAQACPSFATAIARRALADGLNVIADVHDVRPGYSQLPFCVLETSDIRSVADLRGKTIAVNAFGTMVDLIARVVLKKEGLDPRRDVRIVEISFPSIGPALRENRIQGGFLPVPFGENELQKGGIRPVFTGSDAFPTFSAIFQAARGKFLKQAPDAVKAWLDDYVLGLNWLYQPDNREIAVRLAAEVTRLNPEVLGSFFLTKKDYYRNLQGCLSPSMIQEPIDAMVEHGFLDARVDVAPYMRLDLLPRSC